MHDIYGDDMVYTPWLRPGFELGLRMQELCKTHPKCKSILMGQHGLINWADDDKACYELTLELIERAARFIEKHDRGEKTFGGRKYGDVSEAKRRELQVKLLPWLRGQVEPARSGWSAPCRTIATILRFVNSIDAARLAELGTSCPDHFLRTKIKPLYVAWDPVSGDIDRLKGLLADGLAKYREDYRAYYNRCKHADSPAMRDPNPTVILVPGLGMLAWGKDKSESRVTAEFYNCAVEVMRGAEAIDEYVALPQQEAFDIEYWLLEEAKLQADAAGKGTGPAGDRGGRGRQRHRPGGRPAAGQGRGPHRLRRSECRRREGHGEGDRGQARHRHRRGRQRHLAAAARPSASRATSPSAKASAACSPRRSSPTAASTALAVTAGIFVAPDQSVAESRTSSGR